MKVIVYISFIALILSCSTKTSVIGIQKNETYIAEDFKKIAVIAITSNSKYQEIFEDQISKKLQEIGYNSVSGSIILSNELIKQNDKELLKKALLKESIDGVLAISLLDIKEENYYSEGINNAYSSNFYAPYYNSFSDYYYHNYNRVHTPGYYGTTKHYFLESNFYSLISNKLVQTIQSKTSDPADVSDLAKSFTKILVQQLVTGKVLKNKALIEKRNKK